MAKETRGEISYACRHLTSAAHRLCPACRKWASVLRQKNLTEAARAITKKLVSHTKSSTGPLADTAVSPDRILEACMKLLRPYQKLYQSSPDDDDLSLESSLISLEIRLHAVLEYLQVGVAPPAVLTAIPRGLYEARIIAAQPKVRNGKRGGTLIFLLMEGPGAGFYLEQYLQSGTAVRLLRDIYGQESRFWADLLQMTVDLLVDSRQKYPVQGWRITSSQKKRNRKVRAQRERCSRKPCFACKQAGEGCRWPVRLFPATPQALPPKWRQHMLDRHRSRPYRADLWYWPVFAVRDERHLAHTGYLCGYCYWRARI